MAEHHDSVRHHKQNRHSLLQSSRQFSTTTRCRLSYLQQFRGSQQPFSSKPWKLGLTALENSAVEPHASASLRVLATLAKASILMVEEHFGEVRRNLADAESELPLGSARSLLVDRIEFI